MSVTWYLAGMTVLGLIATLLLRDRSGIPLGPDHEAEQSVSPIRGMAKDMGGRAEEARETRMRDAGVWDVGL